MTHRVYLVLHAWEWMGGYLLAHGQLFSSYTIEKNGIASQKPLAAYRYSLMEGWDPMSFFPTHDDWSSTAWVLYSDPQMQTHDGFMSAMAIDLFMFLFGFSFVFLE